MKKKLPLFTETVAKADDQVIFEGHFGLSK